MNRVKMAGFVILVFSLVFVLTSSTAAQPYLEWLKEAEKGNHEKQYLVGFAFLRGAGGAEKNYKKAFEWFLKAAKNGNSNACVGLGDMYNYGFSVGENDIRAVRWYLKASDMGDTEGMEKMGDMYRFGSGVRKNYPEAVKWYRKAAAETISSSPHAKLGEIYYYGKDGVKKDREESLKWFLKAHEFGRTGVEHYIGSIYEGKKDYAEAEKWFLKGAAKGNILGMYFLARLYMDGEVPENYVEACKWLFVLTEKDSYDPGEKLLKRLQSKMTRAGISKAKDLASPLIKKLVTEDDREWKEYSKTLKKL